MSPKELRAACHQFYMRDVEKSDRDPEFFLRNRKNNMKTLRPPSPDSNSVQPEIEADLLSNKICIILKSVSFIFHNH
jgi:hypothetical protein